MNSLLFRLRRVVARAGVALMFCCVPCSLVAADAPQILDLAYEPMPFHAGTGIRVKPRLLRKSGANTRFQCRWFVEGREIPGESGTFLPGDFFARGDSLSVEVTTLQGSFRGRAVRSGEIAAGNAPPEITSLPPETFEQGIFEYRVEVEDADGDDVSIALVKAPEGMRLDASGSTLTWRVPPGAQGVFAVGVLADDGYGGQDRQDFELNLSQTGGQGAVRE